MIRAAVLTFLLVVHSQPALSREMKPLSEVAVDAAATYAPARCAALYQAMMEWVGFDRMGEEPWENMNLAREGLIMFAAWIGQETSGGTLEHQVELAVRDVRNIADLYLKRLEANYAMEGQAFGQDELVAQDLQLCKSITETLR